MRMNLSVNLCIMHIKLNNAKNFGENCCKTEAGGV